MGSESVVTKVGMEEGFTCGYSLVRVKNKHFLKNIDFIENNWVKHLNL